MQIQHLFWVFVVISGILILALRSGRLLKLYQYPAIKKISFWIYAVTSIILLVLYVIIEFYF